MADYSTVRDAILVCRRANVSLFIWGSHGIGKSSIVRQAATRLGIEFVDFRCAQPDLPQRSTQGSFPGKSLLKSLLD